MCGLLRGSGKVMIMKLNKKDIILERKNKTVYKTDDAIIKVFAEGHPKTGVFNEALITAYVESYGVKAAKVLWVEEIDGKWAIATEFIPGKTLEQCMKDEPERMEEWLNKLVDIQLEVNGFKADGLRNTIDKRAEEIKALTDLDPSTLYELQQRLQTQGNAGADAALTYMSMSLTDPALAEKYLKLYSRKSNTAIQYVQKWLPIVAAGQLKKAKTEEETALLEKWISVAEYQ